ncbi:M60 family metallopeptidase [Marinilabilia salmonicolor]|uniref:M60 family metallopeptidase n=1 Tax=Marinilabilia salmonicolor TaxID=989 RepID=UPI000299EC1E|nr:M60 family metallopeptidase [Marinilabilia salmonicolor]
MLKISCYFVFSFVALILGLNSCTDESQAADIDVLEIDIENAQVAFPAESSSRLISVTTEANDLSFENTVDWLNVSYDNVRKAIAVSVLDNVSLQSRTASLIVAHKNLKDTIEVVQFGVEPEIILSNKQVNVDFKAQRIEVQLLSNVDVASAPKAAWINTADDLKSVSLEPLEYSFSFDVDALDSKSDRKGYIYFDHLEGEMQDSIAVVQSLVTDEGYNPVGTNSFEKDEKLNIISATLTPSDKYQPGANIQNSIDGDLSSIYHSPWVGLQDGTSISFEFTLNPEDADIINYIVLHPRVTGINGVIKTASIWVSTKSNADYVKMADIEAPRNNNPVTVFFDSPVIEPQRIKIVVTDAYSQDDNYYVSLAEFECYESKSMSSLENDQVFFTDETFSELEPGFSMQDLSAISNPFLQNIAAYLLSERYDDEYRVQRYEPFQDVWDLAEELKISQYSQYENPTGMYFEEGEEAIVFVGDPMGRKVNLKVRDFGPAGDDYTYALRKGLNILSMKGQGNAYVSYYTPDYQTAESVKIHIASGQVNGYFDISRHTNEDGKKLLDNAVSEIMDIKGKRVQLAYSVNSLSNYSYSQLHDLTIVYDSIVGSQQTMMGLRKYDRLPKNHILGRVIWDGYMHKDSWGAAFHDNTMETVANPQKLKNNNWGVAHEFGHVNQTHPGFMWVGTTEVTNNIFSLWSQFCFTPHNMRLEHEVVGGEIGGRFNAYFQNAFIKNQEWGLQAGPDATYGANGDGVWSGDVFVALAPMWQLQLFFHVAGEGNEWHRPYFYADVFEAVRNTDESSLSHGQVQMNFVKNVCDAVQYDLTDFFTSIGMLKEVDKVFNDYTSARKAITSSMIDETINYISRYPKPELNNVLKYISVNSYKTYQNKLPVSGSYKTGVQVLEDQLKIEGSDWKNVIVYETYSEERLINITMVGTGDSSNSFTVVPYPGEATRVEAVAFDGARTLVFGD